MKNVVKFNFEGKEGFLSYIEKDNACYALIHKDTPKVKHILEHHEIYISKELKKDATFSKVTAGISFDQDLIAYVFNRLEEEKNLYFKQLDDSLCVIEFKL